MNPSVLSPTQELNRVCERVEIQPLSGPGRWIAGVRSLLMGGSATEGMFKCPELGEKIQQWARVIPFDSVLVFCSSMFQYAKSPELSGIPMVVDLVDVDSEKWLNYAETAPFLKRQLYKLEARRVRQLELEIAHCATAVTLVSEEEAKVFRTFCNSDNIHAISNGVDLDYFHPAPPEFQNQTPNKAFKLVFVGVLDYRANIEGLRWFCREVWPQVQKQIPGIELDLVGRRPGDAARQLATIARHQSDRRGGRCPPLRLASRRRHRPPHHCPWHPKQSPGSDGDGANPSLRLPQAIEGTGAISGEHLLSPRNTAEWPERIAELVHQNQRRSDLSDAARNYVAGQHDWETQLAALGSHLGLNGIEKSQGVQGRPGQSPTFSLNEFELESDWPMSITKGEISRGGEKSSVKR